MLIEIILTIADMINTEKILLEIVDIKTIKADIVYSIPVSTMTRIANRTRRGGRILELGNSHYFVGSKNYDSLVDRSMRVCVLLT